ncbi:hypothetical protein K435DRAFT_796315 [Dendrothele bispora CBS 962.96]|uniref:Uncharacterized protein n=1 Tax=Dendrothele bispora (strain CBS 962.96) TaxID=1314807 RepID=A0A4S8M640_DENBC|nr:hypothetical protein K435DRAFT_796315 [Dendrothele bispora CBS 962.96]
MVKLICMLGCDEEPISSKDSSRNRSTCAERVKQAEGLIKRTYRIFLRWNGVCCHHHRPLPFKPTSSQVGNRLKRQKSPLTSTKLTRQTGAVVGTLLRWVDEKDDIIKSSSAVFIANPRYTATIAPGLQWLFRLTPRKRSILAVGYDISRTQRRHKQNDDKSLFLSTTITTLLPTNALPLASLRLKLTPALTHPLDVPHEVRKTEEERRRDWINFMEAVGKLWIAGEEFWVRLKIVWRNSFGSPRVNSREENGNGADV